MAHLGSRYLEFGIWIFHLFGGWHMGSSMYDCKYPEKVIYLTEWPRVYAPPDKHGTPYKDL